MVNGRDSEEKYHTFNENEELIISLTVEYKTKLSLICQEKTLYDYIDEFFAIEGNSYTQGKDLILRFLYDMFTSDLEGYKLILQEQYSAATANANFSDT